MDLEIEEVPIPHNSSVIDKTLEQSRMRQAYGVIILAVRRQTGEMEFNPPGDFRVHPGDVLIAMGERSKLKGLENELER